MRQTIPFTKDITFKSRIGELTSISLDHDLTLKGEDIITGNFYISGTYKVEDTLLNPEKYSYKIPATIAISDEYDTFDSSVDIDDFEYEVDGDVLKIKIIVAIDNLKKKERVEPETREERKEEIKENEELQELEETKDQDILEESFKEVKLEDLQKEEVIEKLDKHLEEKINDAQEIQNNKRESKTFLEKKEEVKKEKDSYLTYSVYIVKEGDTINKIKDKYKVTEEMLQDYNDLDKFDPGVKLIIPSENKKSD